MIWWFVVTCLTASPTVAQPDSESDASETSDSQSIEETAGPEQSGDASDDGPSESADAPPSPLPDAPKERLAAAEKAFNNGNFSRIPTLLRPLLEPKAVFESEGDRIRARELLGVGLYFTAQSATDAKRRDTLMETARRQFYKLLRERPDYELDPLIFPASVVELFESVRDKHAGELDEIRRERDTDSGRAAETLYIEREVERRIYSVNFLPFGFGQFQNDEPVKGALFASGQGLALAANTAGFVAIESLRQSNGKFSVPGGVRAAANWRIVQWASLGTFAGLWILSTIDALVQYQPTEVHIRTLESPPPELKKRSPSDPSSSLSPKLRIGVGTVRLRW